MINYTHIANLLNNGLTKSDLLILAALEKTGLPTNISILAKISDLSDKRTQSSMTTLLKMHLVSFRYKNRVRYYQLTMGNDMYETRRKQGKII